MTLWRAGREGEDSGGAAGSPVGVVCVFSVGALLMAAERTAIPLYLNTKKPPPPAASPQLQGFASSFAHFQAKTGSAAAFWCTFVTPPVNKRCQFRMVSNPPPARLTSALKRSTDSAGKFHSTFFSKFLVLWGKFSVFINISDKSGKSTDINADYRPEMLSSSSFL